MKSRSNYTLCLLWLKSKLTPLLLFSLFSALTLFITFLYHENLYPIFYSIILCGFLFTVLGIISYLKFVNTYRHLEQTWSNLATTLEYLPAVSDPVEEVYQFLLLELFQSQTDLYSRMKSKESETTDYYTLWVHQIKTPISAMRLLLQPEHLEKNLFRLEQELFKIEQYAEMALHYLRLESTSSDFLFKSYSLYNLTKNVLRKFASTFAVNRLNLTFEEFHLSVITDEKWLSFVIEQILSNCLKYSHNGGIRIYPDSHRAMTLVIEDTGIGIKPEDLPRVFEKGFTGYNGHMDKKSTGIGLYLCKQVMDRLGHSISITSELGKGTSVYLYLAQNDRILQE